MDQRETVRAWIQFPLGANTPERLTVANAFVSGIGGRAGVAVRDVAEPLGTEIDVTPATDDPLVVTGAEATDRLVLIVTEVAEDVMLHYPNALITWEAIQ